MLFVLYFSEVRLVSEHGEEILIGTQLLQQGLLLLEPVMIVVMIKWALHTMKLSSLTYIVLIMLHSL